MAIWLCFIAKCTLAIWWHPIAKCTLAIWQQPIAKHPWAISATSYCLNRNDRVSSFYWTRGSKPCFLICFSYFSCYFHILVILLNRYLLISSHLSWLHGNPIVLFLVPLVLQAGTLYMRPHVFGTECVGFLKQDACGNLVVDSLPVNFPLSAFCQRFPVQTSIGLNVNHTFLSHKTPWTDTFSRDISLAKLRSTAWVWHPQEISKLVNKVDCWVPHALLKTTVQAFLAINSFAAGSSTYLCHMTCISKSVLRDIISLSNCRPQWLWSAMDVMHDSRGRLLSIPFLRSSGFSGA